MEIKGYKDVVIEGYKTTITTVKHDDNTLLFWFDDIRDIDYFKTTGYVLKRTDKGTIIYPIIKTGVTPKGIEDIIKRVFSSTPDWQRNI